MKSTVAFWGALTIANIYLSNDKFLLGTIWLIFATVISISDIISS